MSTAAIASSSICDCCRRPTRRRTHRVDELERAGHPVVRIAVDDPYDLGEEFFRWEFATAVAGSILGIHPFDQPDVEASKIATRKLTTEYEQHGTLPAETPIFTADGIAAFRRREERGRAGEHGEGHTDAGAVSRGASRPDRRRGLLRAARVPRDERGARARAAGDAPWASATPGASRRASSSGRASCTRRDRPTRVGRTRGVFLQITCDDAVDVPVPGQKYTFGVVKAAQARGDFQVLVERDRRALRVHLGADVAAHLRALQGAFLEALRS